MLLIKVNCFNKLLNTKTSKKSTKYKKRFCFQNLLILYFNYTSKNYQGPLIYLILRKLYR